MKRLAIAVTVAQLSILALAAHAQEPADPPPGASGNADNVAYIGGRDPNGHPVRLARATGHVSNYDEAKVRPYTLPDPLVASDGERVATAQLWWNKRRPEILRFYETEVYGRVPASAPTVTWAVTETDAAFRDNTVIKKTVVGRMGDAPDGPRINLVMHTPRNATGPVPMLLRITFGFPPGRNRGRAGAFDPMAEALSRGWGYATINYRDIQPDRADAWTEGVIGLSLSQGQTKPAADEWGTISAWAWGISRTIDYFETDPSVNAERVAINGASRLGKTVLWAAARDPRIAAVFSAVPGEMGASLIRRDWGETLDDMAQNFHWQFAGNLQRWVGRWNDLPVDQHMLIALCAPRPVYVNGGLGDQWSDPKGEFLSMVAAGPVYRLLGGRDLGITELPPLDAPIATGDLAFHYHSQGHRSVPADWTTFLDWVALRFEANQNRRASTRAVRKPIPDKLVVLTFDDSCKSHFTVVRSLLKRHGFGATFFITEGFDFRENKEHYMTWSQIAQLHEDGFEIGNHTRDHLGITDATADRLSEQLEGIEQRCREHGIPKPVTFAWPGNATSVKAFSTFADHGIHFARRGGAPEYPYDQGRGFAFEPGADHPLLLPSAGDARPDWAIDDFVRAVEQARDGKVAILQFHGAPDEAHAWVNTPKERFEEYMNYLARHDYTVIALRDLAEYVDPRVTPADPFAVIDERRRSLAKRQ